MILSINDVSIQYSGKTDYAVKNFSVNLEKGGSLGIIGESGSGKTTLLSAVMGLLEKGTHTEGKIMYSGNNLLELKQKELNAVRWSEISLVFQNSLKYLNPNMPVLRQITEIFKKTGKTASYIEEKIRSLCKEFDLDFNRLSSYPAELSGGMRQRVFIIMALVLEPRLILIDEPETALENINKQAVLSYFSRLRQNAAVSLVVVSHNLEVIRRLTDTAAVMYQGRIVEHRPTAALLKEPQHPYTRALIASSPDINPYKDLWGIKPLSDTAGNGCAYYNYCTQRIHTCLDTAPVPLAGFGVSCIRGGIVDLLRISGAGKQYRLKNKSSGSFFACKNCSFNLRHGEIIGVIGESGSGKTTLAKIIAGFIQDYEGEVLFNTEELSGTNTMSVLGGIQMIDQDPYSSVNPHFSVKEAILEPVIINNIFPPDQYDTLLTTVLEAVDLKNTVHPSAKIGSLSGGEIQRATIARALVMQPKLLIADEITASLDISAKVNIVRLLKGLQNSRGFSMIYITHDLSIAAKIADKMIVMKDACIADYGLTQEVFSNPSHEYTKKLLSSFFEKI